MKTLEGARWALAAFFAVVVGCTKRSADAPLQLGYFPNITHAQAIVGARDGTFQKELGGKPLKTRLFNAGPAAMEALLAGAVDVAYVGPGPAISAYVRSGGKVRVLAGAASGGAALVVREGTTQDSLSGQKVAVPQIGNTQDIALRFWAKGAGLQLQVIPLDNPEIVNLFRRNAIAGAWVPEPWVATLIASGGTLLIDERTLWPSGRFPTTVLLTTTDALKRRPDDVKAIVRAHVELTRRAQRESAAFLAQVRTGFEALAHQSIDERILKDAFDRLELVVDPMEVQLKAVAEHSAALGYLPSANVAGLVDASMLNSLVPRRGEEGVGGSGPDGPRP